MQCKTYEAAKNAQINGDIKRGAVKKLSEKINQNSSARVGAVSCVCEYTESVTSKAK